MGQDKDVDSDMVSVLESSTGTTRKRMGGNTTVSVPAAAVVGGATCSSRSVSPADSADTNMTDEQMDAIIEKLPHWVDQLGGIRNLVLGRRVLVRCWWCARLDKLPLRLHAASCV